MRATSASRVRQSLRAAVAIGRRDARAAIYGLGLYVVMFISLVAAGIVLRNDLSALQATDFVIALNPLKSPLVVYIQVVAIYIAISSAITVARDRDRGTLELLIYGPVDYASYLLGKFLSQITCYAVCVIFGFVSINLFAIITGFVFELGHLDGLLERATMAKHEAAIAQDRFLESRVIGGIDVGKGAALGFPQRLTDAIGGEGEPIHCLHELGGAVVRYRPEADEHVGGPGQGEAAA